MTLDHAQLRRERPRANGSYWTKWATKGEWKNQRGEQHRHAKLTEFDVKMIRGLHGAGVPMRTLGEQFGVSHQQVWRIIHRANWSHVP
jgi:hypothetical protein